MTQLDQPAGPRGNLRIGRDHKQHRRAVELCPQGRHVDRPGQQLVAIDLALHLDNHPGHRAVGAVVQNRHGIGAILRRCHLRQIEPRSTRAWSTAISAQVLSSSAASWPLPRNKSTRILWRNDSMASPDVGHEVGGGGRIAMAHGLAQRPESRSSGSSGSAIVRATLINRSMPRAAIS